MDDKAGDKERYDNSNNQAAGEHIQIARVDPKANCGEHSNACNLKCGPAHVSSTSRRYYPYSRAKGAEVNFCGVIKPLTEEEWRAQCEGKTEH